MARTVSTDFLHSMRFHVSVVGENPAGYLKGGGRNSGTQADAGFTSCTLPELTVEPVTYREGNFIYERKYAGLPTVSDVTLQRGVAQFDSSFWRWAQSAAEGGPVPGSGNYREDIVIDHFHRQQALLSGGNGNNIQNFVIGGDGPIASRRYHCFEAFATRHKVAGDLDSTASEVSLMELDFAMEYFTVEEVGASA